MGLFEQLGEALDPNGVVRDRIERETTAEQLGRMTVKYELANKQRDRFEAECDRLRDIIIMNGLADQLTEK